MTMEILEIVLVSVDGLYDVAFVTSVEATSAQ